MSSKTCISLGAILAGLSVILGAFAAHGLEGPLISLYQGETRNLLGREIPAVEKYLQDFKTAAEYQMYHALGMILLGLRLSSRPNISRALSVAPLMFLVGILLFSGSLYFLVLTKARWLGMVAPLGGLAFIIGWAFLAIDTLRS